MRGVGRFAHAPAAWRPGAVVLDPRKHARALLDGLWPLDPRVLAQRLAVYGLCVAAAALLRWYAPPTASDDDAPPSASAVVTHAFTVGTGWARSAARARTSAPNDDGIVFSP